MTAGEGTTICSRYFDVLFQGKAGSLIINAEKVIFRPKEGTVESGKPTSRSWRWAAIDRVEVLAASSSSSYRQLKLKSSGNDKKAITLSIPGGILDDVLQDMNRRLDVEGPVQKSKPNGHRRRSMSRTGGRSMSHRTLSVDPQNNKKDNNKDKDKPAPARRLQRTRSRSLTDLDQRKKQSEGGNNINPRRQRRASRRPTATSTSSTTGNTRGEREMSSSARGTRDRARERDLSSSAHGRGNNRELSSSAHGSSRTTTHRNSLSGLSRLGGAPHGATGPASRQSSRSVSRSQRRRRSSLGVPVVASAASVVSSARSAAPSSSPLTTPPSLLDNTASRRSPSERRRRSSATTATTARRSPSERRRSPSTRSRRSPSTRSRRAESPVAKLHGNAKVVSASTTTNNSRRASAPMVVTTPHSVTTNTNNRRASAPMVVPTTSNNVNVVSSIVATNTRPRRKSESPSTIEKIKESAKNSQQKAEEETRVVPWDDNNDDDDNHPKKGLFKAAQQKLKPKYPLLKPPEKYRQIGEEDSSALSNSNHNNNNHKSKPQRGFLNFMKAPPTRKSIATSSNIGDEIAQMEAKAKQQAARRRSLVESNQQRKASLRAKKDRLTSPQQQHAKGKVPRPDGSIQLAPMVLVTKVPSKNNHHNRDHHNNNPADNNHSPIASKRRDIVVKPQQDDTSRTSASSTPDSPTKDHNHNRSLVQAKPPNPALWNPNSPEHKFRMMILHHAATCQVANGGACPYDPICCDFKRVLRHMESCNDPNCTEDKCKPTREFLVTMRLMTTGDGQDQQSHKDFLVGMGAMAPIPVIDVGEGQGSHVGDWDAFSMVSESSWWSKAGA